MYYTIPRVRPQDIPRRIQGGRQYHKYYEWRNTESRHYSLSPVEKSISTW